MVRCGQNPEKGVHWRGVLLGLGGKVGKSLCKESWVLRGEQEFVGL